MKSFETIKHDIASGSTTCEKITASHLEEIDRRHHLNAFLSVFTDSTLERARSIDLKLQSGTAGYLAVMVVAVKDNICIKNKIVTCGSHILENYISPYDAEVIKRLNNADAIIIGKTNLDEFAMGSSTENSAFGPVLNPHDECCVPGGSSGGSAVAVASGLATSAIGTDTGGSIRQPAAMCGIVGLKPTYGRISRY